jgi:uroporphyrinogen-III decarboxylase
LEKLNNRERVMAALSGQEPDRVPYCELSIDRAFAAKLLGWSEKPYVNALDETTPFTIEEAQKVSTALGLDNIFYLRRQPVYVDTFVDEEGRIFPGNGKIKTADDLAMINLPDPHKDEFYTEAESFAKNKGDYAAFFLTRGGLAPVMLSMGIDHFCLSLYDDIKLIEQLLDIYFGWMEVVAERICQLDFDVFCMADDFAFNTGMMFAPDTFNELIVPHYRRIAEKISIPWVFHSDGNIQEGIEMLIGAGVAGIHPIEKGAMDIRKVKKKYGDRLCIFGNVDLVLLGSGSAKEVEEEVFSLIHDIAPGGGYIMTSGNSLADYLKPECVLAISKAIAKYGNYPVELK